MARKSRKNVGLIGLGIIGSRIAAGLRAAGYHVFVWNRSPKPAPNFVGSPAEVAEICDIIQLFVADAQAAREVIEAFGDQLGPKHVVINCATIGPEAAVDVAQLVQARGAAYLDAPFTGSKGAADKAQLVYYVGGDEEVFVRAKPVLEATSRAIVRCGRVGDASTLKVATNLITAVTTQTLAEALAIVKGAGIPPEAFAAALENNACKSGVVELKLPKMVSGDYEPHFSVKHMFKDVQLGIHMANQLRLEVPLTTVVGGVLYGALCNGWGDLDFASLYRVYSDAEKAAQAPIGLPEQGEETPASQAEEAAATEQAAPEEKPGAQLPESGAAPEPLSAEPLSPESEAFEGAAPEESKTTKTDTPEAKEEETVKAGEPLKVDEGDNVEVKLDKIAEEAADAVTIPKAESPAPGVATLDEAAAGAEEIESGAAKGDETRREAAAAGEAEKTDASDKKPEGAAAVNGAAEGAEGDEENGLAGFFSRVFRRKGTPVGK